MKVILIKDVAKIGRRGSIVVVPDGFALNKLIPKGFALAATPENIKRQEHVTSKLTENKEHEEVAFVAILQKLSTTKVTIEVEANVEGRMFQALKVDVIADAIATATASSFEPEYIVLVEPIKTVGEHEVGLVHGAKKGSVTITVVSKNK